MSQQHCAPFQFKQIQDEKYLHPISNIVARAKKDFIRVEHKDIRDDIYYCIEKTKSQGLDILVIRYNRPELPVATVKVIIPGTLHIWPQFELPRLYQTPVKQGWREQEITEEHLNKHLLYV